MDRPTCGTCVYWEFSYAPEKGRIYDGTERFGECRRYPPKVNFDLEHEGETENTAIPVQIDGFWCGEHHLFPAYIASLKATNPEQP